MGQLTEWLISISSSPLIIEHWYLLRCLPLLHTATCIKNSWAHAKLQKVYNHENQPCGTVLVTAPDQGLEPFYKLVNRIKGEGSTFGAEALRTPADCSNCHLHHLANMRTRMTPRLDSRMQKFWISP